ncbi:NRT2 ribosyltransferase, partial [Cettia cetti]|nr:NRT2 ribosyltransferase [Cettia cetti]
WPLPTMAPLAHTLALLAMTVATAAIEVVPLDMALDSFDDRYWECGAAMTAALPALNRSEFQQNPLLAKVWVKAAAKWQSWGPPETALSPDQATAIVAFTMDDLHIAFNDAVRVAGSSPQQYRDNFHFKTLHFLLTQAQATLRDVLAPAGECHNVLQQVCGVQFGASRGQRVRFGEFRLMSLSKPTDKCSGKETVFHVHTCHSVDIKFFAVHLQNLRVVIPPFETFEVTEVIQQGDKTVIHLRSTGTFSKYNCEWLKGDTTGDS